MKQHITFDFFFFFFDFLVFWASTTNWVHSIRAGMSRDFVHGYPSPYYPQVPVTIVLWTCTQEDNSLTVNLISMASLSLAIVSKNLSITTRSSHNVHWKRKKQLIFTTKDGMFLLATCSLHLLCVVRSELLQTIPDVIKSLYVRLWPCMVCQSIFYSSQFHGS